MNEPQLFPDEVPFRITWQARLVIDLTEQCPPRILDAMDTARRIHLATMREPWAKYIADGSKRVESRWGKVRCAPHDTIGAGDVVVWKRTGGPVYGVSVVEQANTHILRGASDVAGYVRSFHAAIRIPDDPTPYMDKVVVTLIWLGPFVAIAPMKCGKNDRAGWNILQDGGER